jgi:hypothetical protein
VHLSNIPTTHHCNIECLHFGLRTLLDLVIQQQSHNPPGLASGILHIDCLSISVGKTDDHLSRFAPDIASVVYDSGRYRDDISLCHVDFLAVPRVDDSSSDYLKDLFAIGMVVSTVLLTRSNDSSADCEIV